jgi:hypothetical protein
MNLYATLLRRRRPVEPQPLPEHLEDYLRYVRGEEWQSRVPLRYERWLETRKDQDDEDY